MKMVHVFHASGCIYFALTISICLGTVFGETGSDRCDFPCPHNYDPVCGSDGRTYSNECQLRTVACRTGSKITTKHQGRCGSVVHAAPSNCSWHCTHDYNPVCGSNGKTYSNECELELAACRSGTTITVAYRESCSRSDTDFTPDECNFHCPFIYDPVCGSDGTTHINECQMRTVSCRSGTRITVVHGGRCRSDFGTTTPSTNCSWHCPHTYDPVCGSDGKTYNNECHMDLTACLSRTRITVAHRGVCRSGFTTTPSTNCSGHCPHTYDPVCGSDGKTYHNECHMDQAACLSRTRITVAHRGSCESDYTTTPSTNCSWHCPHIHKPVCGSDGRTYSNTCLMKLAACRSRSRIAVVYRGPCRSRSHNCLWDCCPYYYRPVCGSDGMTYGNECQLRTAALRTRNGIRTSYPGRCV